MMKMMFIKIAKNYDELKNTNYLLVICFQAAFYVEVQVLFSALESHARAFVAVILVLVEAIHI